jgi:murein DD-endopeptidase MepM/ murein hydrolase activator NlpD
MQVFLIILLLIVPCYPTIPTAPISQEYGHLGHVGIDFKIPEGTPVYADIDGVIIEENNNSRYGNYIMIKHSDGYVSLYGHLSEYKVEIGDSVISGDLIGLSGDWSAGAHLHWEVRAVGYTDNNLYNVNPMEYLMSFLKIKSTRGIINSYTGVNIRAEPSLNSPILYTLSYKENIEIVEENNGWLRIKSVRPEWVMKKWVDVLDK